jgi:hypothetical protein
MTPMNQKFSTMIARFVVAALAAMACIALTLSLTRSARASSQQDATQNGSSTAVLVEALLTQLGGRAKWAAVKTLTNDSLQFRVDDPVEVRALIRMDFTTPRWRIDTTAPTFEITRVAAPSGNWRRTRTGEIEALPPATLEGDQRWYRSHVYRTLHRLATNASDISTKLGKEGRLEVFERESRIAWFKLNTNNEPYAFGGADDGPGSISGPWRMTDQGIKHPVWVTNADGTWRSALNGIVVNQALTDGTFQRPAPAAP